MNDPAPTSDILGQASNSPNMEFSQGTIWDVSTLIKEHIEGQQLARWFQKRAFIGGSVLIALTFGALLWWMSIIAKHAAVFLAITTSQVSLFVGPVIVLGSVGALLALALLRFAFGSVTKEDNEPSPLSILHGVAQQALDLGKDYFRGKRLTE